ncbi:unnamed protein product [Cercospora beticola]|nr:unnamed protein product [Cercospora beticola]
MTCFTYRPVIKMPSDTVYGSHVANTSASPGCERKLAVIHSKPQLVSIYPDSSAQGAVLCSGLQTHQPAGCRKASSSGPQSRSRTLWPVYDVQVFQTDLLVLASKNQVGVFPQGVPQMAISLLLVTGVEEHPSLLA